MAKSQFTERPYVCAVTLAGYAFPLLFDEYPDVHFLRHGRIALPAWVLPLNDNIDKENGSTPSMDPLVKKVRKSVEKKPSQALAIRTVNVVAAVRAGADQRWNLEWCNRRGITRVW